MNSACGIGCVRPPGHEPPCYDGMCKLKTEPNEHRTEQSASGFSTLVPRTEDTMESMSCIGWIRPSERDPPCTGGMHDRNVIFGVWLGPNLASVVVSNPTSTLSSSLLARNGVEAGVACGQDTTQAPTLRIPRFQFSASERDELRFQHKCIYSHWLPGAAIINVFRVFLAVGSFGLSEMVHPLGGRHAEHWFICFSSGNGQGPYLVLSWSARGLSSELLWSMEEAKQFGAFAGAHEHDIGHHRAWEPCGKVSKKTSVDHTIHDIFNKVWKSGFCATSYDTTYHNCQHFCEELWELI